MFQILKLFFGTIVSRTDRKEKRRREEEEKNTVSFLLEKIYSEKT